MVQEQMTYEEWGSSGEEQQEEMRPEGNVSLLGVSSTLRAVVRIKQKYQALKKRRQAMTLLASGQLLGAPARTSPKIFTFDTSASAMSSQPLRKKRKKRTVLFPNRRRKALVPTELSHARFCLYLLSAILFLQNNKLDVQFCPARVKEFCNRVERKRSRYEEIYEATECSAGAPSAGRGQAQDSRAHYHQLHDRILDNITCQTRTRFQEHERLMFLSLLDLQTFWEYQKTFLHAAFSILTQSHGKSPTDLLDFLQQKNRSESMGQLYTLVGLTVTTVSTASVELTFSAQNRIKTYARNTTGQTRLSALALMAIEKNFLMDLKRTCNLYHRVIEIFLRKERRMHFVYK
ncbi:torsin-4A isoform X3 [Stigmatopora argus]